MTTMTRRTTITIIPGVDRLPVIWIGYHVWRHRTKRKNPLPVKSLEPNVQITDATVATAATATSITTADTATAVTTTADTATRSRR